MEIKFMLQSKNLSTDFLIQFCSGFTCKNGNLNILVSIIFLLLLQIVAIGVAVSTYNEGAADFKETPAYRESIKSEELLEEPEANSDVFESNPTEVAPSLD